MNQNRWKKYINDQIKLIQDAKWLEGEKTSKDPGNNFIYDWADKYAKKFRKNWIKKDIEECLCALNSINKDDPEQTVACEHIKIMLQELIDLIGGV